SMVRVQAGRLRTKLAEYYNSEGVNDRLVIEVPKGSYAIAVHERVGAGTHPGNGAATGVQAAVAAEFAQQALKPNVAARALGVGLLAAVAIIGWLLWTGREPSVSSASQPAVSVPAPIEIFWRGFVRGSEEPWVIFS